MTKFRKFSAVSLAVLMGLGVANMADARGKHGGGKHHGGGYHHSSSKVERLTAILGLDETQVANLQAIVDLRASQRENEDIQAAKQAISDAAAAEIFSSFTYTEAVAALAALKTANANEMAAVKAVFLESLTAEQRATLASLRGRRY